MRQGTRLDNCFIALDCDLNSSAAFTLLFHFHQQDLFL